LANLIIRYHDWYGCFCHSAVTVKNESPASFRFRAFGSFIHLHTGNQCAFRCPIAFTLPGSVFYGEIPIRIDALSAWFMLIINLTCVNGALYGIGYMKPYQSERAKIAMHWVLFLIFQTSMLWVCMLQHSLAFLIAWEVMSLSSMFLVIFEHEKKETLRAGINYLVQMHIGVAFLTVAFLWVYFIEGSFDFAAIAACPF